MTALQYMIRKNEIIHDLTELTLIPDDQLIDVPPQYLFFEGLAPGRRSDAKICPYCIIYLNREERDYENESLCAGCPMDTADNNCITKHDDTSTYEHVREALREDYDYSDIHEIPAIQILIAKYNKQFGKQK